MLSLKILTAYVYLLQKHHHQEQHQNGLEMECGVTGAYTNGTTPSGILSDVRSERSPAKAGLHVNFKDKGEIKERREKFLTAKYGNHQMSLIRKRLAVEMWLYEELKKLYETATVSRISSILSHWEKDPYGRNLAR